MTQDLAAILTSDVLEKQRAHVIDLCIVKSVIGPLWSSVCEGLGMRLDSILRRNLSGGYISVSLDDGRHLIVLPEAEPEQAAAAALRIAHDFTAELLGHCEVEQLRIERVTAYDAAGLHAKPLKLEETAQLAEKARLFKPNTVTRARAAEDEKTRIVHMVRPAGVQVTHRFDPIWDARHEAITTYLCMPDAIADASRPDTAIEPEALDLKERLAVEMSSISTGIGYLSRFVEAGERFVLGVPVNFDTLSSPFGRMEFGRLFRGVPVAYRPYLLFLLTGVPLGVAQSRLSDLAALLRPFGRTIASVAAGCRNFNAYQGQGLYAIALDISRADTKAPLTTSDIVHVATAARNSRMISMVCGITDTNLVNQACAAEIQLLHGTAVAPSVQTPKRMSHLPRNAILPVSEEAEEWF